MTNSKLKGKKLKSNKDHKSPPNIKIMRAVPRILMVNDYPLDKYYENWRKRLTPSQQLWGKVELDRLGNFEVVMLPHEKYPFLNKIGNLINITHLDQQVRVLFQLDEIDVIYAPFAAANTKFLLVLKLMGIIKVPIIAVIHYPLLGSNSKSNIVRSIGRNFVKGFDRLVFISHKIKEENVKIFSLPSDTNGERFVHMDWGAEASFYKDINVLPNNGEEDYAISVGQTDRDFDTLIEAFKNIDFKLRIYSKPGYVPRVKDIPSNVEIFTSGVTYKELLGIYKNSRMILICFKMTQQSTLGMTSLLDAMAMGKPVVITENEYLDVNANVEKIGYTVAEEDVNGWVEKINLLLSDAAMCIEFGKNALNLHKEKYNMNLFGINLNNVFKEYFQTIKGK